MFWVFTERSRSVAGVLMLMIVGSLILDLFVRLRANKSHAPGGLVVIGTRPSATIDSKQGRGFHYQMTPYRREVI